jgi:deoxyribodipyrimidine photo-lyase
MAKVDSRRIRILKEGSPERGPVVYWMSRDQRLEDNWALLFAQELALERKVSLAVLFCLVPRFLDATIRHYGFMLKGLGEVETGLGELGIPFFLLSGEPGREIPRFAAEHGVRSLVTDFDPLKLKGEWKRGVADKADFPIYEVDGRNIVPCWIASGKQEFGAYTLRPKIRRALPDFCTEFPALRRHPIPWKGAVPQIDWGRIEGSLHVDRGVPEVDWLKPGERAARELLHRFLHTRLSLYPERRNDPTKDGVSHLSPYLHFGQISAQRAALEVRRQERVHAEAREAFLEELIVRRELSDNFCFYNPDYDRFSGFPAWAQKTLNEHRRDRREYLYSSQEFEGGRTHDDLWNAAQLEMVRTGKMHGYMRMYWAKKILEWTKSPEEALRIAIYLNDRYELDGRDANGYVGIAWAIGGVHDRAWGERAIFGKIRFMSARGCKSKFNVKAYTERNLPEKSGRP